MISRKRRLTGIILAAAALVGGALAPGTSVAATATTGDAVDTARHYIKSPTTGRCLLGGQLTDHETGWVGTKACIAQYWMVFEWRGHFDAGVYARIEGVPEGTCLDSNSTGSVYMRRCSASSNQFWEVSLNPEGYARIENRATRRCLEEPFAGGEVKTYPCRSDTSKQSWRFVNHPAS